MGMCKMRKASCVADSTRITPVSCTRLVVDPLKANTYAICEERLFMMRLRQHGALTNEQTFVLECHRLLEKRVLQGLHMPRQSSAFSIAM
jgi:hypothetical protein